MIQRTSGGPGCSSPGDYLSWDDMAWNIAGDVVTDDVSEDELCRVKGKRRVFFNRVEPHWQNCMDRCDKYRGARAVSFEDQETLDDVVGWIYNTTIEFDENYNFIRFYDDVVSTSFWIPYKRIAGKWLNYYTQGEVDLSFGLSGPLVDHSTQVCGAFIRRGWSNFGCNISPLNPVSCACQHPQQIYLQLRGLCPKSNIDQFYIPQNKDKSGNVLLYGTELFILTIVFITTVGLDFFTIQNRILKLNFQF